MKSDLSRQTFDPKKHYSSVRMQQGRVQLDADWNEQTDIVAHRIETEALDVIGGCGGPLHSAAFHIVANVTDLTVEEQNLPGNDDAPSVEGSNFLISAGRYYVDGILCENDHIIAFTGQPDLPDATPITDAGLYLVYLDVWQRPITALDDPSIREVALGGPDTATRTKTVWQVKQWFAGENTTGNCLSEFQEFQKLIAASDGKLSARAKPEAVSSDPCIVPPGAGYRGLENQLYRVEIHDGGAPFDVTGGTAGTTVTEIIGASQVNVDGDISLWKPGQAVELFPTKSDSNPMAGILAYITVIDSTTKTLTLNTDISSITMADQPRLRQAGATFKWSRDNGSVVTTIEQINPTDQEITVHDLGPDTVLGFAPEQWVEITDDGFELNGQPGQLAQIAAIDPATNVITLKSAPTDVEATRHPKLRRWDGIGTAKFNPPAPTEDWLDLESGIQVKFSDGVYRTGDYWTIPARTATADAQSGRIEWPQDTSVSPPLPTPQSPFGIQHHYCRLALAQFDGTQFTSITDCRNLFPPVTELTSLFSNGRR